MDQGRHLLSDGRDLTLHLLFVRYLKSITILKKSRIKETQCLQRLMKENICETPLYKISMDDIQAELHLRNLDYVPEHLLEIYNRTSGEFDYLADVETNDYTLQIELSEDESRAYVNIIPPSEEGDPLTMELIIAN